MFKLQCVVVLRVKEQNSFALGGHANPQQRTLRNGRGPVRDDEGGFGKRRTTLPNQYRSNHFIHSMQMVKFTIPVISFDEDKPMAS